MRNGQNVLVYAPRRYGKSSLVLRAAQEAMRRKVLVAYCRPDDDADEGATRSGPGQDDLRGHRVARWVRRSSGRPISSAACASARRWRSIPSDGSLRFSFQAGRRTADIDDTIERLLELLGELAAERKRRVVIVFDEFQEISPSTSGSPT